MLRAREVELGAQPRPAQLGDERERALALAVGGGDEDVVATARPRRSSSASRIRSTPAAQPIAGVGGPAEQLDQPVVAAAAADLRLGAEARRSGTRTRCACSSRGRGPASRRARRRCPAWSSSRRTVGEVLGVLAVEPVEHRRRLGHHRPGPLVLGVEGAQRVLVDPLAHVLGQLGLVPAQVGDQLARGRRRAPPATRGCRAAARAPGTPSARSSSSRSMISSASTSGESEPIASAPIWLNWRKRPACGRSWRKNGPELPELHRLRAASACRARRRRGRSARCPRAAA